jgi:hypothetical protein
MKLLFAFLFFVPAATIFAQPNFKIGWNTYKAGSVIHQYTYKYTYADSTILTLTDTLQILTTADSLISLSVHTPMHERSVYKTANFFNGRKQVVKTEEYKDEGLLANKEWRYDDKNRKSQYTEENKTSGNTYKKVYDYNADKKTGDFIITEISYYNGKVEFYTKSYYDKSSVKYKEVRLNDNNKDIIHIETYTYGENGKVRERSVFFPEFKVTKKFDEKAGMVPAKCFRTLPLGVLEKPSLNGRLPFIKKLLAKNQAIIYDKACSDFEYKFSNGSNCEVIISTTKVSNCWQVIYRFREKV